MLFCSTWTSICWIRISFRLEISQPHLLQLVCEPQNIVFVVDFILAILDFLDKALHPDDLFRLLQNRHVQRALLDFELLDPLPGVKTRIYIATTYLSYSSPRGFFGFRSDPKKLLVAGLVFFFADFFFEFFGDRECFLEGFEVGRWPVL